MNGAELDPREAEQYPELFAVPIVVGPEDVLAVSFAAGALDEGTLAQIMKAFLRLGISDRVLILEGVNLAVLRPEEPKPKGWEDVALPFDEASS